MRVPEGLYRLGRETIEMEDPRTKEEKEAGLTYEEMMKKRKKEAQEAEKDRIQAQNEEKEKIEKIEKKGKTPLVTIESIHYGSAEGS